MTDVVTTITRIQVEAVERRRISNILKLQVKLYLGSMCSTPLKSLAKCQPALNVLSAALSTSCFGALVPPRLP